MAAPGAEARALFAEGVRAVLGGWAALQVRGHRGHLGDTLRNTGDSREPCCGCGRRCRCGGSSLRELRGTFGDTEGTPRGVLTSLPGLSPQLAVAQGFGGPQGPEKAAWLSSALLDFFTQNGACCPSPTPGKGGRGGPEVGEGQR